MPELPDVQIYKQYIDSTSLHQTIHQVEVTDDTVLEISSQTLASHLRDQRFEETERLGKRLFLAINGQWLMLHFGMTGSLQYSEDQNVPEHSRVLFWFENGARLAYICPRKLGAIDLTDSPGQFAEEHDLGADALDITLKDFRRLLGKKRGMIKSALMDQSTIGGLGNVYSDEVLYQSNIHPKTKVGDLSDNQIKELHQNMQRILKTAVNNRAKTEQMPDHYLMNHRKTGADCPDCGGNVKRTKVSGRGCYFCPDCQKQD